MIIDIHTHVFPDELAPRAVTALAACAGIPAHTDGTCAGLRASMQQAGVDYSVIMPIATKPSQVRTINDWAASVNQSAADLICFGTLHPAMEDWQAEIDRLVTAGIPGVKFHPEYQQFFVDDTAMTPMYRALAAAGRVVLFHAGVDIGIPPPVHCPPERLARVLDTVPELTVIAAHMGGYQQWDDVVRHLIGRELYLDSSYSLADLGDARMTDLIHAHGAQRILFGSDSPWTAQSTEVAGIHRLPLTPDAQDAILGGNAAQLLQDYL